MDTICSPAGSQWLVPGSASKILHWGAQKGPSALGCICSSSVQKSSVLSGHEASWAWCTTSWILRNSCFFISTNQDTSLEASAYQDCQWCSGLCQVSAPQAGHEQKDWEAPGQLSIRWEAKWLGQRTWADWGHGGPSCYYSRRQLPLRNFTITRLRQDAQKMEEEQHELSALQWAGNESGQSWVIHAALACSGSSEEGIS